MNNLTSKNAFDTAVRVGLERQESAGLGHLAPVLLRWSSARRAQKRPGTLNCC